MNSFDVFVIKGFTVIYKYIDKTMIKKILIYIYERSRLTNS